MKDLTSPVDIGLSRDELIEWLTIALYEKTNSQPWHPRITEIHLSRGKYPIRIKVEPRE